MEIIQHHKVHRRQGPDSPSSHWPPVYLPHIHPYRWKSLTISSAQRPQLPQARSTCLPTAFMLGPIGGNRAFLRGPQWPLCFPSLWVFLMAPMHTCNFSARCNGYVFSRKRTSVAPVSYHFLFCSTAHAGQIAQGTCHHLSSHSFAGSWVRGMVHQGGKRRKAARQKPSSMVGILQALFHRS